jgi:hypothetical protein
MGVGWHPRAYLLTLSRNQNSSAFAFRSLFFFPRRIPSDDSRQELTTFLGDWEAWNPFQTHLVQICDLAKETEVILNRGSLTSLQPSEPTRPSFIVLSEGVVVNAAHTATNTHGI